MPIIITAPGHVAARYNNTTQKWQTSAIVNGQEVWFDPSSSSQPPGNPPHFYTSNRWDGRISSKTGDGSVDLPVDWIIETAGPRTGSPSINDPLRPNSAYPRGGSIGPVNVWISNFTENGNSITAHNVGTLDVTLPESFTPTLTSIPAHNAQQPTGTFRSLDGAMQARVGGYETTYQGNFGTINSNPSSATVAYWSWSALPMPSFMAQQISPGLVFPSIHRFTPAAYSANSLQPAATTLTWHYRHNIGSWVPVAQGATFDVGLVKGNNVVELRVTDEWGRYAVFYRTFFFQNFAPTANMVLAATQNESEVQANGTASTDSDGTVVEWEWKFYSDWITDTNFPMRGILRAEFATATPITTYQYEEDQGGKRVSVALRVRDNDGTWSNEILQVFDFPEYGGRLGLCIDENGIIYTTAKSGTNLLVYRYVTNAASQQLVTTLANHKDGSLFQNGKPGSGGPLYLCAYDSSANVWRLRKSDDFGGTWNIVASPLGSDYVGVDMTSVEEIMVAAGVHKTNNTIDIFRSLDQGTTWTAAGNAGTLSTSPKAVSITTKMANGDARVILIAPGILKYSDRLAEANSWNNL
jgi:hypothetical protein